VAFKWRFRLHAIHSPQADLAVKTCRSQKVEGRDGEQVHNFTIFMVPVVCVSGWVVSLTTTNGFGVLHHVVAVNLPITATRVESVDALATPFKS